MGERPQRYRLYGISIAVYVVAAFWAFYSLWSPLGTQGWQGLLVFMGLLTYFQLRSITFADRFNYSLSMVVLFPAIYIYGVLPGMGLAVLGGLIDGISLRKKWDRALFNVAQLSLSAAAAGLAFRHFGGTAGQLDLPGSLLPMVMGVVGYFVVNIGSVTFLLSLRVGESWWSVLNQLSFDGLVNYAIVGYMGILCALFTGSWQLWGAIAFGGMLVGITELLQMGLRVNIEQNRRAEAEEAMLVDVMTGTRNFRYLNQWIMEDAGKGKQEETLLFLDIDDFKAFNDRYGHARGDDALRAVANAIGRAIRDDQDTLVRYGGEEFVVILPNLDQADGSAVAERIREHLAAIPEAALEKPLTVSIGLASRPGDSDSRPDLLRKADLAMYQAKKMGKDCCCVWQSSADGHGHLLARDSSAVS